MHIAVLSDLHLEFGDFVPVKVKADVFVLAGDIAKSAGGPLWARQLFPPERTICIAGNHEFYGSEYNEVIAACRTAAAEAGQHFLESDSVVVGGVRFLGAILWADFRLYGDSDRQHDAMDMAGRMINDFRMTTIAGPEEERRRFQPGDALFLHEQSRAFLEAELAKPFSGETVVITHFLPSRQSISERFKGDPLNPYFCSDLTALIEKRQPALWIHGHTHDSCDYRIGKTRVVCNPRGYFPRELNPAFDPGLVIEV